MKDYQPNPLGNSGHWRKLIAGFLLFATVPIVIAMTLPDDAAPSKPLTLTYKDAGLRFDINNADGHPVMCLKQPDNGKTISYDCDGVVVESVVVNDSHDQDRTLRRITKAIDPNAVAQTNLSTVPITTTGTVRRLDLEDGWFFSVDGTDDKDHETLVVAVEGTGHRAATLANSIYRQLVHDTGSAPQQDPQHSADATTKSVSETEEHK